MTDPEYIRALLGRTWSANIGLPPDDTSNFLAMGGDSLRAVRIMESVEEQLGIEFPLETLLLDDFATLVAECAGLWESVAS